MSDQTPPSVDMCTIEYDRNRNVCYLQNILFDILQNISYPYIFLLSGHWGRRRDPSRGHKAVEEGHEAEEGVGGQRGRHTHGHPRRRRGEPGERRQGHGQGRACQAYLARNTKSEHILKEHQHYLKNNCDCTRFFCSWFWRVWVFFGCILNWSLLPGTGCCNATSTTHIPVFCFLNLDTWHFSKNETFKENILHKNPWPPGVFSEKT